MNSLLPAVIAPNSDELDSFDREMPAHPHGPVWPDGRGSPEIARLDHEQSKRELPGESELDQQDAVFALTGVAATSREPRRNSAWTDSELDESILTLCDEFPGVRMAACSRALEYCRRWTPRGTPESLMTEMRATLLRDLESSGVTLCVAA